MGKSEGEIEEFLLTNYYNDVDVIFAYFAGLDFVDAEKIGMAGHSLGAVGTLLYAAKNPLTIKALCAISPFNTFSTVQLDIPMEQWKEKGLYPKQKPNGDTVHIPYSFVEDADKAEVLELVRNLTQPKLIIGGSEDKVVDPEDTKAIYDHAAEPKELAEMEGIGRTYKEYPEQVTLVDKKVIGFFQDTLYGMKYSMTESGFDGQLFPQRSMEFVAGDNVGDVVNNATFSLHEKLAAARGANSAVVLLVSGGSALEVLKERLPSGLPDNLTICPLDDRVSSDPGVNTYTKMTTDSSYGLIAQAREQKAEMIDTLTGFTEGPKAVAERVNAELEQWFAKNPRGCVIAILGMGPDGHTAGIFPGHAGSFLSSDRYMLDEVIPSNVNPFTVRISATEALFKRITTAIAVVTGREKEDQFRRLTAGDTDISANELPAILWRAIPQVIIFTDLR